MASVTVSHLIMFIASLVIAASVAGTLVAGVDRVSSSVDDRSDALTIQIDTDVTIISDPGSDAIYDGNGTVSIYVKNTGRRPLDPSAEDMDVLIDGRYMTNVSVSTVTGTGWARGDVIEITVEQTLDPGDHRISIIVNRNTDLLRFRVE